MITRSVDTTFVIPYTEYKEVIQVKDDIMDTLTFVTDEATVTIFLPDTNGRADLARLKSVAIASIRIEPKKVELKVRETYKHVKKENDNPIKNFFFMFGIIAFVIILIIIILKFI